MEGPVIGPILFDRMTDCFAMERSVAEHTAGQANVLEFRSLVEADPALQAAVERHVGNGTWDAAAIVEIGRARGLDFTPDDLERVMDQDDELSDFELELVAAAAAIEKVEPNP
jgi:predicted ribosomally synthesized peptide with nif11-like leader